MNDKLLHGAAVQAAPSGGTRMRSAPSTRGAAASRLLHGPILGQLTRLALPTSVVMLAQIATTVAEVYFISTLGTSVLAGAALVFPLQMLMATMSAGGIGNGVASALSRAVGSGANETIESILTQAILIALVMGLFTCTVMLLTGGALYHALGAEGQALNAAVTYSNLVFIGAIPLWITNLAGSAFRGLGNPMLPARVTFLGAVCLIPASALLVFGWGPVPGLGVAGAGLALLVYYSISALVLLLALRRQRIWGDKSLGRVNAGAMRSILKIGVPSSLNAIQSSVLALVLTSLAASISVTALAAYGIVSRLESALIPLLFGLASATLTGVGVNHAAQQYDRARRVAWTAVTVAVAISALPSLVAALHPQLWITLFTHDVDVIAEGMMYLRVNAFAFPLISAAFILSFASQGAGHAFWPSLAVTLRLLAVGGAGWLAIHYLGMGLDTLALISLAGSLMYVAVCLKVMYLKSLWNPA